MREMNLLVVALVLGCFYRGYLYDDNSCDESFIPYRITSFDVFVYNDNTDKEYYAGNIETDYQHAQARLIDAQCLAYAFANAKRLKNWSYICCTVTDSSSCVTKVR